jgi:hypothetical protein
VQTFEKEGREEGEDETAVASGRRSGGNIENRAAAIQRTNIALEEIMA